MAVEYEQVEITSRAQWRAWLTEHSGESPGIWLVTFKKAAGDRYVRYADVVEEALCFGWIDGQARKLDGERSQLLLTPRRKGSGWSRPNKERVGRLLAAGHIEPPGLAAIERAKADGSWTALDDIENLVEPDDLRAALDRDPEARWHWDAFPRSAKRGILEWIAAAKRPETREKRVAVTAESAARGVRANQWRPPEGR